jgi:hypothetical protein
MLGFYLEKLPNYPQPPPIYLSGNSKQQDASAQHQLPTILLRTWFHHVPQLEFNASRRSFGELGGRDVETCELNTSMPICCQRLRCILKPDAMKGQKERVSYVLNLPSPSCYIADPRYILLWDWGIEDIAVFDLLSQITLKVHARVRQLDRYFLGFGSRWFTGLSLPHPASRTHNILVWGAP